MPNHVLEIDCSGGITGLEADLTSAPYAAGGPYSTVWIEADFAFNSTYLTALLGGINDDEPIMLGDTFGSTGAEEILVKHTGSGGWSTFGRSGATTGGAPAGGTLADTLVALQFYRLKLRVTAGTPATADAWISGTSLGTITMTGIDIGDLVYVEVQAGVVTTGGALAYFDNVIVGTTEGASDILSDDFEGVGAPSASIWNSFISSDASVVVDPGIAPPTGGPSAGIGRVGIAFDDGPLEPNPSWSFIDQPGGIWPPQFVAGYDIKVGRQTLLSQTDTGTATVYVNDHEDGLFDDRNLSSPVQGKLSGRQIVLQLFDPVTAVWETQFRGLVNDYSYSIDGSASDANGDPINASIQIECVDMFDYLNGFGLTPGLAGDAPPAGAEDGVYYAATAGTVDDRIIEILTDAGIDPAMYGSPGLASGNVKVIAVKYDPGESALTAIRDAVDAEFPFLGICYCDRFGKFQMRGRYGRFDPDAVAGEPGSDWDFARWGVADEKGILADPTRAQMRVLGFSRDRANIINVAGSWPQGLPAADMPDQFFADTSSITAYGQHAAPPMSDLLTSDYAGPGTITPSDGKTQCYLYAKLLVKNQAFPREAITALQVKSIDPDDYRAPETWAFITQSDISHIVNVMVGYPGGTGFAGDSPKDDYYIEGRSLVVRPLNPTHDYVEYNVEVSPAVWSMDTHSVFPPHEDPS